MSKLGLLYSNPKYKNPISSLNVSQLLKKFYNPLKCKWDLTKRILQNQIGSVNPNIDYGKYCYNFAEFDYPKSKTCSNCGYFAAIEFVEVQCTFSHIVLLLLKHRMPINNQWTNLYL